MSFFVDKGMLRTRCPFTLIARRNYSSCYKLREWMDEDPHRYLRKIREWGWKDVVVTEAKKSDIVVPEGYVQECRPLPELEQSAQIEKRFLTLCCYTNAHSVTKDEMNKRLS